MACYSQVRIGSLIFSGYAVNCSSFRVSEFNPCFFAASWEWFTKSTPFYLFVSPLYFLQYLHSWLCLRKVLLDNFICLQTFQLVFLVLLLSVFEVILFSWRLLVAFVCLPTDQHSGKKWNCYPAAVFCYDSIIYLQTNVMMYSCGCNVFPADSISERVTSLTILSAYRPIQCGGNVLQLSLPG